MKNSKPRKPAIVSRENSEKLRRNVMVEHMERNLAYQYAVQGLNECEKTKLLNDFRKRYLEYRNSWRANPAKAIDNGWSGEQFRAAGFQPLSVDLEVASVCDLACPFCYRQFIATPDKTMEPDLYFKLIDQCADLSVPSVKLNWRGEPLLHPRLPEFVRYAKRKGILEVIINTNATTLDERKGAELIDAGLDLLIYSFDGASKATYEKMRPGRFKNNHFDKVYENIRGFANLRRSLGAIFPRTKIQMILTKEAINEQDEFFELFENVVDDVSVKAYTERGGKVGDLSDSQIRKAQQHVELIDRNQPMWKDHNGRWFVSKGRLPCEQPFQRLMVTYDGRVSMCCYDWGMSHPVGYVSDRGWLSGDEDYLEVVQSVSAQKKGFAGFMDKVEMPKRLFRPKRVVRTLRDIWFGAEINQVRKVHISNSLEELEVCRGCPFKDTYDWMPIGD